MADDRVTLVGIIKTNSRSSRGIYHNFLSYGIVRDGDVAPLRDEDELRIATEDGCIGNFNIVYINQSSWK